MSRTAVLTIRRQFLIASAALLLCAISGRAQFGSNASGQGAQPAAAESPGAIISFLNQTIVWSRQLTAEQQLVNEPSDALFLNDSRQLANQVVRLAFDYARARAQALANQGGEGGRKRSRMTRPTFFAGAYSATRRKVARTCGFASRIGFRSSGSLE